MIIEKIVGNLSDIESLKEYHLERVYLDSDQLLKKILRVKTDHGTELGIDLADDAPALKDGDILLDDGKTIIAIFVNSSKVIKISPKTIHDMGDVAHQLGNRHLPAQFVGNDMYVEYDYLVERLLKQLNIPYEVEDMKLDIPFRHVSIEGGHDDSTQQDNKDINKEAHIHTHEHEEYEHSHEHLDADTHHDHHHDEHEHLHEHEEYEHSHAHPEDDKLHDHKHVEHEHEHEHEGYSHTHVHSENQKSHAHSEHTHEHEHNGKVHSHAHPTKDEDHKHSH